MTTKPNKASPALRFAKHQRLISSAGALRQRSRRECIESL